MYSIGQIERITGLTKDKLRYYEEKGLVTPSYDAMNNYRRYSYYDLLTILSIENYRKIDFGVKEIKALNSHKELTDIHRIFAKERVALEVEVNQLRRRIERLERLEASCLEIENHLGRISIRAFGPYVAEGTLSDFTAFDEYEGLERLKHEYPEASILDSLVRQMDFDETGVLGSHMVIVRPQSAEVDADASALLQYDTCVYCIVEDSASAVPDMGALFERIMGWIGERGYLPIGKAYLKLLLLLPREAQTKSYLELFVPVRL